MKNAALTVMLVGLSWTLTACNKAPGDPAGTQTGTARSSAPATQPGTLKVEPGVVSACEPVTRIKSHVSWRVDGMNGGQVKIMVTDPGSSDSKLFSQAGPVGELDTGTWVIPGMRFDIVDASTGAEIDRYEVKAAPCDH